MVMFGCTVCVNFVLLKSSLTSGNREASSVPFKWKYWVFSTPMPGSESDRL